MRDVTIRFNDFQDEIFRSVRNTEFCDVTLLGDDRIPVMAHRMILASSSSFFRNLFESQVQSEIVIHVDGMSNEDLQIFLYVIYNRTSEWVNLNITRVREISKQLCVDFLSEKYCTEKTKRSVKSVVVKEEYFDQQTVNTKLKIFDQQPHDGTGTISGQAEVDDFDAELFEKCVEDFEQEKVAQLIEVHLPDIDVLPSDPSRRRMEVKRPNPKAPGKWIHNAYWSEEQELRINDCMDRMTEFRDGVFLCKVCRKTKSKRTHMSVHLELHLPDLKYFCDHCGEVKRTSNALRKHIKSSHKQ